MVQFPPLILDYLNLTATQLLTTGYHLSEHIICRIPYHIGLYFILNPIPLLETSYNNIVSVHYYNYKNNYDTALNYFKKVFAKCIYSEIVS